jgi:hypothetical protein
MNAVQSFWISEKSVNAGGWINKRFEYISWSLSYCLLRQNFQEVHLYCNTAGYKMLVEELELNYDKVSNALDSQEELMKKSWALTKIFTYAAQQDPYVHVDGDVFWFEKPSDAFLKADVFAQCIEVDEPMYREIWSNLQSDGAYLPEYLKTPQVKAGLAANVGIIGGNQLKIFKEFYQEAILFLERNTEILEKKPVEYTFVPYFIEQLLFLYLANHFQMKITFLKKPVFRSNFSDVLDFNLISPASHTPGFLHLLGSSKYKLHLCNRMEFWLHRYWPEQLKKINSLYQEKKNTTEELRNMLNPENEKRLPYIKWIFDKPEDVLAYPFIRTQTVFGIDVINYPIQQFEPHSQSEKIIDCIRFEEKRIEVLQWLLIRTDSNVMFQHFESHLNFCLRSHEAIKALKFELNRERILKSEYNWFNDLLYTSQYYWYNLIIDSQRECFQEFLLSETECKLLELFEDTISFEELTSAWINKFPTQNQQKTEKTIHEALKELIGLDLIRVCGINLKSWGVAKKGITLQKRILTWTQRYYHYYYLKGF